ncbi:hypothetical protein QFZ36_001540 [Pseudarthrobacter siccitolerans]|uniref:Sugar ABC transporter ATPase n=1 Tax=Pseudarthrobacter siccitolerans TaxID=861266 RepID=A0ABU0PJ37_9MICC|nr:hypothetical protein [Pseudarthrobacter siccitolerans]MDQ0673979.1 hypothetical protein [Pseudarthrobacter siccitolerans]
MNIGSQPEMPRDVPEADALEQQTPVLPEDSDLPAVLDPLPDDAPEADVIEQHTGVKPGSTGFTGIAGAAEADAAEADLVEQAVAPSLDDEEDYPDAREEEL